MSDWDDFVKNALKIEEEERLGKNQDYYVSKQAKPNGNHEIHTSDCQYLPDEKNRKYLGCYNFCRDALKEAEKYYKNVNGCIECSALCHSKIYKIKKQR